MGSTTGPAHGDQELLGFQAGQGLTSRFAGQMFKGGEGGLIRILLGKKKRTKLSINKSNTSFAELSVHYSFPRNSRTSCKKEKLLLKYIFSCLSRWGRGGTGLERRGEASADLCGDRSSGGAQPGSRAASLPSCPHRASPLCGVHGIRTRRLGARRFGSGQFPGSCGSKFTP